MFYVEVYRKSDGQIEKRSGPMTERKAEKIEAGMMINLNHEQYETRIVTA